MAASLNQDTERAGRNLKQLEALVTGALNELQRLIADLRPSHLDDLGLPATLRWWADEIESRVSLEVDVTVSGKEVHLPAPVRLAIFRATQEAITNIIKHADAVVAKVNLTYNDDHVSVTISDNGCGFDMNEILSDQYRPSWGLLGMQERASLLGGEVNIDSRPGIGTTVQITIPYLWQDNETEEEMPDDYSTVTG